MRVLTTYENYNFNKQEAQRLGRTILWSKPAQSRIFDILTFVCQDMNGIGSRSYESIANQYANQYGKTISIQRVGAIVNELVKAGLVTKSSAMIGKVRRSVCTFRIAHIDTLYIKANEARQYLSQFDIPALVQESKEVVKEAKAAVRSFFEMCKELLEKKHVNVQSKPSTSRYNGKKVVRKEIVPDWAINGNKPSKKPVEDIKKETERAELQALLAQFKKE